MKKRILVFGNEYIAGDSLAVAVGRLIKAGRRDIEIIECRNPDEVYEFYSGEGCYILDVAKDIDRVITVHDIDKIIAPRLSTLHDFDLGFFLKLLKSLKKIEKVTIICLPMKADIKQSAQETLRIIDLGMD